MLFALGRYSSAVLSTCTLAFYGAHSRILAQTCDSCGQIPAPAAGDINTGCPIVFNFNGTASLDHNNVPFGTVHTIQYTLRLPPSPNPRSDSFWLLMRHKNSSSFTALTSEHFWCCRPPSGGNCTNCTGALGEFICASQSNLHNWPQDFHFTIPSNTAPDDYEIVMSESPTSPVNTVGLKDIIVTIPNVSDIVAGSLALTSSTAVAGQNASGNINCRNAGELPVTFTPWLYMSTDSTVDESDTLLFGTPPNSVGGGGHSFTRSFTSTTAIPTSVQGARFFRIKLTPSDGPDPSKNWSKNTQQFNFQPDLRFASPLNIVWQGPFDPANGTTPILVAGDDISFSFNYENFGSSFSAPTSAVEVYFNSSPSISGVSPVGTIPLAFPEAPAKSGILAS